MSGIADLILAGLIIVGWPGTARWALGLFFGVNLIISGLAITMSALAGRMLVKSVASAMRRPIAGSPHVIGMALGVRQQ